MQGVVQGMQRVQEVQVHDHELTPHILIMVPFVTTHHSTVQILQVHAIRSHLCLESMLHFTPRIANGIYFWGSYLSLYSYMCEGCSLTKFELPNPSIKRALSWQRDWKFGLLAPVYLQ